MKNKNLNNNNIIFIISQPRSGSTFLQRILDNHSQIATSAEPWFLLPIFKNNFKLKIDANCDYDDEIANYAINQFKKLSPNYDNYKNKHLLNLYKDLCFDLTRNGSKRYFLDKTPRYYQIIDKLLNEFPDAKYIMLIRNPVNVLHSMLKTWIKRDIGLLKKFKSDLIYAPAILEKYINNSKIHKVKYEDLCLNTEIELKKILNYLNLKYEPNLLDISKRKNWKLGDPKMNKELHINTEHVSFNNKNLSAQQWRLLHDYTSNKEIYVLEKFGYNFKKIIVDLEKSRPNKLFLLFTIDMNLIFNSFLERYYAVMQKLKDQ